MKLTFTSVDVKAVVAELQNSVVGLRVHQIYDVDHKTYLIKLQKPEHKAVLLIESAARMHTTEYQWPKNPSPSGFSMKLRKHLRNKRLEEVKQLGVDRVVQLTFGSGDARHYLIVELYDRGNITLTDSNYTILIILRPRTDGNETKLATYEVFPINKIRTARPPPTAEKILEVAQVSKPSLNIKKLLNPLLDCGSGVLEHELTLADLTSITAGELKSSETLLLSVEQAAERAQQRAVQHDFGRSEGFIIQRMEERRGLDGAPPQSVALQQEFHPSLYEQHKNLPHLRFESFNKACDEFFQQVESVRLQQRAAQQEKDALRKLDNVRADHSSRLAVLHALQEEDTKKGQLIELNQQLVDSAIEQMRTALAHQLDWREIDELLQEAQEKDDPVACAIKKTNLSSNTITMLLSDPYDRDEADFLLDSDEEREEGRTSSLARPITVDIDLDISAFANARKYYDNRRKAVTKVQKTMAASQAAIKSATKKAKKTLKEVHTTTAINKLRKFHWFEKFIWFISSENYLVLAGHDQQQNEVLVKKYMKSNDVYVHADLHGAASVIIKNSTTLPVSPATLHQAGNMALCFSRAWAEKVVTSAWWVWGHQVSKTAPSGEYLSTGSFMIRGTKNFLPPSHLVYGFGFLFRLEESSVDRHKDERKVRTSDCNEVSARLDALSIESSCSVTEEEVLDLEDNGMKIVEVSLKEDSTGESENEELNTNESFKALQHRQESNLVASAADDNAKYELLKEEKLAEDLYNQFPDTVVEVTHIGGSSVIKMSSEDPKSFRISSASHIERKKYTGKHERKLRRKGKLDVKEETTSTLDLSPSGPIAEEDEEVSLNEESRKSSSAGEGPVAVPLKRGQKSKLKKIRTKYKNQDSEERAMMMHILQSAGQKKEPKKQKDKKRKSSASVEQKRYLETPGCMKPNENLPSKTANTELGLKEEKKEKREEPLEADAEEEDGEEAAQVSDDLAILKALTGEPMPEDELLYCVPVCAPYTALANYKYKVKLTPGPGKKGKACKAAVSLFLSQKPAVGRECDLIRAVRDSDLAKNVPGKVKVSAPNISKVKK